MRYHPGLARTYPEGQFDGEFKCLAEVFGFGLFSWTFITGGLCSGKTTAVMHVVITLISGPVGNCKIPDDDCAKDGPDSFKSSNSEHPEPNDATTV
ncbi:hypothetical protein ACHAPJ_005351 [Fusarium lateritium]